MGKKILVIEDEDVIASILKDSLESMGHDVTVAGSGVEGLRRAKALLPEVIILDMMMAGLDGIQVLKELKADDATSKIPVIIVSVAMDIKGNEALKLGAVAFFKKPIDFEQLNKRIKSITHRKKVLVVEDNPEILKLLSVRLTAMGYMIIEAENGKEVAEKARQEKPDVILLDIVLPEDDGFEITRKLKGDSALSGIPVIVFSGYFSEGIDKNKIAGVEKFLDKEFSAEDLAEEVDKILRGPE